jgi:hypothetical protein
MIPPFDAHFGYARYGDPLTEIGLVIGLVLGLIIGLVIVG